MRFRNPISRKNTRRFSDNYQKNAKIDGFRKGKVPREMIIKRYQGSADVEVIENVVKAAYINALEEKNFRPISEPDINFDSKLEKDKPFKFKVQFDVPPTMEIGEYKKLTVKENECKIEDKDIEKELQSLRERYATVSRKEKDETAEKGNYVKVDAKRIDNVEPDKVAEVEPRKLSMILGKEKDEPSFDDEIIGMKADEEKEVTKKFPKDYDDKELAGEKAKFLIKVTEISNLSLPALDNEFAKDLGNYADLDEVKKKIREDFESFAKDKIKKCVNNELMNKIIEDSKFDVPESIVKREIESITAKMEANMGMKEGGLNDLFEKGLVKKDEFLAKTREESIRNIKATLVLLEIAKVENLKPSEEKYKEIITSYAARTKKSVEEVEKMVEQNGSKENIEHDLLLNSAVEFIYDNANVKKQKAISFDELQKLPV